MYSWYSNYFMSSMSKFAGPCAPGVSDPRYFSLPSCPSSLFFPSSFLPFFLLPSSLFPLRPDPIVLGRERAHIGGRQGGLARQTPRFDRWRTSSQLRLKIALFFWCRFLPFSDSFGSQDDPKIFQRKKKRLQNRTWFWSRFWHHFFIFLLDAVSVFCQTPGNLNSLPWAVNS